MKIDNQTTIRLKDPVVVQKLASSIKMGDIVNVRIIQRLSGNRAIIELSGHSVHADFTHGIPSSNRLSLLFYKQDQDTLFLKMADSLHSAAEIKRLLRFIVSDMSELGKMNQAVMDRAFPAMGVFAFNELLLFHGQRDHGRDKLLLNLLKQLLKIGINKDSVLFFSYIYSGIKSINLNMLLTILPFVGAREQFEKYKELSRNLTVETLSKGIDDFIKELTEKFPDVKELLKDLIDIFQNYSSPDEKDLQRGTLPIVNDEVSIVRYVSGRNSFLFSAEFSRIGLIDVLIKDMEQFVEISLFCSSENIKKELKAGSDELQRKIRKALKKNVQIGFYLNENEAENIMEAFQSLMLNRTLDVMA